MPERIKDYSIADFLIQRAREKGYDIIIKYPGITIHFNNTITPEKLTNKFLQIISNNKDAKIGIGRTLP